MVGFGPLPMDDSGIQKYERSVIIKQERFKRCGVGHRLWPAAHVMSRWIYERAEMFKDKKMIECNNNNYNNIIFGFLFYFSGMWTCFGWACCCCLL